MSGGREAKTDPLTDEKHKFEIQSARKFEIQLHARSSRISISSNKGADFTRPAPTDFFAGTNKRTTILFSQSSGGRAIFGS